MRKEQVKRAVGGTTKDVIGASQVDNLSARQRGRDVENRLESGLTANLSNFFVPVVDKDNNPLMPTTCSRAKRWIKSGYGLSFVGGTSKGKISLHNITDGKRLCQNASPSETKFLAYNSFLTWRGNSSNE